MSNAHAQMLDGKPDFAALSSQSEAFDEPIFDRFYDMDSQDTMAPSPKRVRPTADVPELPPKSALRGSRSLGSHALKLAGSLDATELVQAAAPHDIYLSSEEDVSSDAGDFSDYDYDSSVEDPTSPTRQSRREDTARVVSVVFAGKPSIVDLPATRRRPQSSSSTSTTRARSNTDSAVSARPLTAASTQTDDRPATRASTAPAARPPPGPGSDLAASRKSTFLSELVKKRPPFLSIDPYANSSVYSLPKALDSLESEHTVKTPHTPTGLFRGVTRSLSLVRKRSKPAMNTPSTTPTSANPNRSSLPSPLFATVLRVEEEEEEKEEGEEGQDEAIREQDNGQKPQYQKRPQQQQHQQQQQQPQNTPQTPVTYMDILKAVKKNATMIGAASPPSDILSPTSPGPAFTRRGILSGLSVRRRSAKTNGSSGNGV